MEARREKERFIFVFLSKTQQIYQNTIYKNPSEISADEVEGDIQAFNRDYCFATDPILFGHWVLAFDKACSQLDKAWEKVIDGIKEGKIWQAKVSPITPHDEHQMIFIYTPNYSHREEIFALYVYLVTGDNAISSHSILGYRKCESQQYYYTCEAAQEWMQSLAKNKNNMVGDIFHSIHNYFSPKTERRSSQIETISAKAAQEWMLNQVKNKNNTVGDVLYSIHNYFSPKTERRSSQIETISAPFDFKKNQVFQAEITEHKELLAILKKPYPHLLSKNRRLEKKLKSAREDRLGDSTINHFACIYLLLIENLNKILITASLNTLFFNGATGFDGKFRQLSKEIEEFFEYDFGLLNMILLGVKEELIKLINELLIQLESKNETGKNEILPTIKKLIEIQSKVIEIQIEDPSEEILSSEPEPFSSELETWDHRLSQRL